MARENIDFSPVHDYFRSYSCQSRRPVLICLACPTSDDRRSYVGLYMRSTEVYTCISQAKDRAHERRSNVESAWGRCERLYAKTKTQSQKADCCTQDTGRRIQPEKTHTRENVCLRVVCLFRTLATFDIEHSTVYLPVYPLYPWKHAGPREAETHHHLRTCVLTLGSPRSLLFFSFSCRLLKPSCFGSSSGRADDRPNSMGEMNPHNL